MVIKEGKEKEKQGRWAGTCMQKKKFVSVA